jgi:uncharacterized protein YsxB (DUF464 family)
LLRKRGGQFTPENNQNVTCSEVVNLLRNQVVNLTGFSNLKPKQHSKEQELDEDILDIQQNVGQAVQIQQHENVLIWGFFAIKWKKIERAFFKYFLSPKHRGWFIFVMLNIALFLCIIDILLKRVHLLTSWSLIPFIIASYLLLDTLLRCIKDLVK